MQQVVNITSAPKQELYMRLNDGNIIQIKLEFVNSQIGWFMDIEYNGVKSTCHRVTNCPNIIRETMNIFPFGIACSVEDGQEPFFVDDFSTERAFLYVLSKDEVNQIEKEYYGKIF
jgi:hypothetical protein